MTLVFFVCFAIAQVIQNIYDPFAICCIIHLYKLGSFQMVNVHSKTNKYVRRYQFGSVFLDRAAA